MTELDIAILIILLLIALGGYRQGFLRGMVRLLAILAIGVLSALLLVYLPQDGTVRSSLVRAGLVLLSMALAIATIAWLVNRTTSQRAQRARWNRALGIVPALVQGLVVAAVLLGLAHRLAITPDQQEYIAQGIVSGTLSQPLSWLEQLAVGQS